MNKTRHNISYRNQLKLQSEKTATGIGQSPQPFAFFIQRKLRCFAPFRRLRRFVSYEKSFPRIFTAERSRWLRPVGTGLWVRYAHPPIRYAYDNLFFWTKKRLRPVGLRVRSAECSSFRSLPFTTPSHLASLTLVISVSYENYYKGGTPLKTAFSTAFSVGKSIQKPTLNHKIINLIAYLSHYNQEFHIKGGNTLYNYAFKYYDNFNL